MQNRYTKSGWTKSQLQWHVCWHRLVGNMWCHEPWYEPNIICHSLLKNLGIINLQCNSYCHIRSDSSCKLQSSMTIFHYTSASICRIDIPKADELKVSYDDMYVLTSFGFLLETLRSRPIIPENLPSRHCLVLSVWRSGICRAAPVVLSVCLDMGHINFGRVPGCRGETFLRKSWPDLTQSFRWKALSFDDKAHKTPNRVIDNVQSADLVFCFAHLEVES